MNEPGDEQPTQAISRRALRESGKPGSAVARRAQTSPAADKPRGGIATVFAQHRTAWLVSAAGIAFLMLGTGALFAGAAVGSKPVNVAATPSATGTPPRPQPSAVPAASRLRTCSVAAVLADPRLATFAGYVANAATGETLLDRNGTTPQRTGSVLKTLTAAAALNILGPNAQLSTRVIDGSSPGTIVLQGGGDPTLATTPASFYTKAPQISDLASAAMKAYTKLHPTVPVTSIVLDSTLWDPADNWDSSWLRKEQTGGAQAEVTALMVDGGRADPTVPYSPRSNDPIGDAGRAFASAAGLTGVTFSSGAAVGTTVLAEVKSQTISTLVHQMLETSDNITAEMLARLVSKAMGFNGSSASLAQAIPGALTDYGVPTSGVTIRDGSGLSDLNSVSPQFITLLMAKVNARVKDLGVIYDGLPVAGVSGSLATRYTGANAIADGKVLAKTGWLDSEYSLAGIIKAADGTVLVFAFYSIRTAITEDARLAQDTLATAVYKCGNGLANI